MSGLDRAFFANSGTEAMEAALKAVRAHWQTKRVKLVALHNAFHGRTLGALAITGQPALRKLFEPLGPPVTFIEANNPKALQQAITNETAALILEPVMGEAGIYPLEEGYLKLARHLTSKHNVLLIADETQCGLGRTGMYFAYQWAAIRPDVVVTAKPLAAGLPLGATLFTQQIADSLPVPSHGTTFGGGPLTCRVALEFLAVMEELVPQINSMAGQLLTLLEDLQNRHSIITSIRSKGMMFGLQLSKPGHEIVQSARMQGLIINCTHETVLRLLPPYTLTAAEAAEAVSILHQVLQELA